jgi:Icc protein
MIYPEQQIVSTVQAAADVLRVVQITDTHLSGHNGGSLLGMDTDHSLQQVIDLVQRERSVCDLLLATGDLSDHGAHDAYRRLHSYFGQLTDNHFWLPGNHDLREEMAAAIGAGIQLSGTVDCGNWQVLMLDSQIPGEVGGELGMAQLAWLRQRLQDSATAGKFVLVCLHHQPVPVGCAWLDQQMVADARDLFAVLDAFEHVRGVLWGHVHQQIDLLRHGVKLMATPSSCVQFAPGSAGFKVDDQSPGYRWLDLHPDGRIETGVSRVTGVHFNVDLDSSGYL